MSRIEVDDENVIVLTDEVVDNDENDPPIVEPIVKIDEGKTNFNDISLVSTYSLISIKRTVLLNVLFEI